MSNLEVFYLGFLMQKTVWFNYKRHSLTSPRVISNFEVKLFV